MSFGEVEEWSMVSPMSLVQKWRLFSAFVATYDVDVFEWEAPFVFVQWCLRASLPFNDLIALSVICPSCRALGGGGEGGGIKFIGIRILRQRNCLFKRNSCRTSRWRHCGSRKNCGILFVIRRISFFSSINQKSRC